MKTLSFFYCLFFETMPGIFGILGSVFFIILTIDDVISISEDKNIAVSLFTFILCIFMNTFCIVKIILCIYASSFCILTSISKIFMNTIIIHIREQCMNFRDHLRHKLLFYDHVYTGPTLEVLHSRAVLTIFWARGTTITQLSPQS